MTFLRLRTAASDEDVLLRPYARLRPQAEDGRSLSEAEITPTGNSLFEGVGGGMLAWAAGGSILAARFELRDGFAANIGGGFHHACPDHGEGFCVIHDVAIAIRRLQAGQVNQSEPS